jgi:uracil-DNA glycosylase
MLIVGSNPSQRSPTLDPFHSSTRSRIILDEWFSRHGISDRGRIKFINLVDRVTSGNVPLRIRDILPELDIVRHRIADTRETKIVALGSFVDKILNKLNISHFTLPHPSGLNRRCNDKQYVDDMLVRLASYLDE